MVTSGWGRVEHRSFLQLKFTHTVKTGQLQSIAQYIGYEELEDDGRDGRI